MIFLLSTGISFGGDICVVKMGREGNKSMEGSVAMFIVCCIIGLIAFKEVYIQLFNLISIIITSIIIINIFEMITTIGISFRICYNIKFINCDCC